MSLMIGNGPFGHAPAGVFNRDLAREGLLYLEPSPRRLRGILDGEVVVDSVRAAMLFEHGRHARYYVPEADVRPGLLAPNGRTSRSPAAGERRHLDLRLGDRVVEDAAFSHADLPPGAPPLAGLVTFRFSALDEWLEEDEPVLAHARDPYHRVDAVPSSREVRVSLDGLVLAESRRTVVIFETSLMPRWYFPPQDVLAELLPGNASTTCAYKGHPDYWSVRTPAGLRENIAWSYAEPLHDALAVAGRIAFFDEHVDLDVDGERRPRPPSPWASPRWWERIAALEGEM